MAPRFRGYGYRNIGGWEVRDNCARAGRNLNFASAGILLYQLSGAKVGSISYGGASLPASHPQVFAIFGLFGFGWLAYRFLLAYRSAKDSDPWWHVYIRDIVLKNYPVTKIVNGRLVAMFAPKKQGYSLNYLGSMHRWNTLVFPEVKLDGDVVGTDVVITLTRWELTRAHIYCFPRYLISNSDIADMLVPWALFFLALASLVLESIGADPAGLYGLLSHLD